MTPKFHFRVPFLFLFGHAINLITGTFGSETLDGDEDMVRMHVDCIGELKRVLLGLGAFVSPLRFSEFVLCMF